MCVTLKGQIFVLFAKKYRLAGTVVVGGAGRLQEGEIIDVYIEQSFLINYRCIPEEIFQMGQSSSYIFIYYTVVFLLPFFLNI